MIEVPGDVKIWQCGNCGETFSEDLQTCPNCYGLFGDIEYDCDSAELLEQSSERESKPE